VSVGSQTVCDRGWPIRAHAVARALLVALALTTACTKPSESRAVADRFMERYYVQMNVAEAAELCGGAARARLEGELRALQGVAPDAPADTPPITFTLTASTDPTPTQATYTYRVTAHTSDVGKPIVTLTLTDEGGQWLVTTLGESEGPPAS
jgi:hypothetical protein